VAFHKGLPANARNDAGVIYRRGPGAIVRESASALANAARSAARTGADMVIEGREEDREVMIWEAIETALEILQGGKDDDERPSARGPSVRAAFNIRDPRGCPGSSPGGATKRTSPVGMGEE
jgi:hypothetical protein